MHSLSSELHIGTTTVGENNETTSIGKICK